MARQPKQTRDAAHFAAALVLPPRGPELVKAEEAHAAAVVARDDATRRLAEACAAQNASRTAGVWRLGNAPAPVSEEEISTMQADVQSLVDAERVALDRLHALHAEYVSAARAVLSEEIGLYGEAVRAKVDELDALLAIGAGFTDNARRAKVTFLDLSISSVGKIRGAFVDKMAVLLRSWA